MQKHKQDGFDGGRRADLTDKPEMSDRRMQEKPADAEELALVTVILALTKWNDVPGRGR